MSRFYRCDECDQESAYPPFELTQVCEELDDDGDPVIEILHLCSTRCLANFAMALAMDFPEADGADGEDADQSPS